MKVVEYLAVFAGAGIGGVARHGVNQLFERLGYTIFPISTLAINVTGSIMMGCLAAIWLPRGEPMTAIRLFLGAGVLGGFTTFSTFSLDAFSLLRNGQLTQFWLYVSLSVVLSLAGLYFGFITILRLM